MAFQTANPKGRIAPAMNVTPLVDVVLVLLIIFMVIAPMLTRQFSLRLPVEDQAEPASSPADAKPPIVLSAAADGKLWINREAVSEAELPERLRRMFAARGEHVLFFSAEDDVPYGHALAVLDRARGAGALTIAVLTEPPTLPTAP